MNGFSRYFHVMVFEGHLLGKMKKCMQHLDRCGKYFYIKHYKNDIDSHYHIIFESNDVTCEEKVAELFETYVARKVFVRVNRSSISDNVDYFLGHGEYDRKEIVSTMKLK